MTRSIRPVARACAEFEFADRAGAPGESYYYVRVQQRDGQMAWHAVFLSGPAFLPVCITA